ncbi:unnamed protein product, partial [Rotaria sp. Silwood2]
MCDIAKQFYLEQFSEHENKQSAVETEADLVDQELDKELQNLKLDFIDIKFIDVKKAVLSLKNKNSTGLDDVSNRIIKCLPSSHLTFVTASFDYMFQNFPLFKGIPHDSCVDSVLFIVFHYDILNAVSNLHFKHIFADDLAIVLSPLATWSSKLLIPYLSQQISN